MGKRKVKRLYKNTSEISKKVNCIKVQYQQLAIKLKSEYDAINEFMYNKKKLA